MHKSILRNQFPPQSGVVLVFLESDSGLNQQLDKIGCRIVSLIDKMTEQLRRMGHHVNHKRIRRLMRQMGLEAIYPYRRRGFKHTGQVAQIYPYLIRDVQIIRPDQVVPYFLRSNGFNTR